MIHRGVDRKKNTLGATACAPMRLTAHHPHHPPRPLGSNTFANSVGARAAAGATPRDEGNSARALRGEKTGERIGQAKGGVRVRRPDGGGGASGSVGRHLQDRKVNGGEGWILVGKGERLDLGGEGGGGWMLFSVQKV